MNVLMSQAPAVVGARRLRLRKTPQFASELRASQRTPVSASMSGQYLAGTPFFTHIEITLWLLMSFDGLASFSLRIKAVVPPAMSIAELMAGCHGLGCWSSGMCRILR